MNANLNNYMTIYPSENGWLKIRSLITPYGLDKNATDEWIEKRRTEDGGYRDEMWSVINDLGQMFYMGNNYFDHVNVIIDVAVAKKSDDHDTQYYVESPTTSDSTCKTCGSKKVEIRGRAPMDINRTVCPTCAVEKLESYEEQRALENWLPSKGDST